MLVIANVFSLSLSSVAGYFFHTRRSGTFLLTLIFFGIVFSVNTCLESFSIFSYSTGKDFSLFVLVLYAHLSHLAVCLASFFVGITMHSSAESKLTIFSLLY